MPELYQSIAYQSPPPKKLLCYLCPVVIAASVVHYGPMATEQEGLAAEGNALSKQGFLVS
jgi:hypothetical protein